MRSGDLLNWGLIIGGGYAVYSLGLQGKLGADVQSAMAGVRSTLKLGAANLAGTSSSAGATAATATAGRVAVSPSDQTVIDIARNLGTTAWRVAEAANRTGKTAAQLTLADLQGVPLVPASIVVGGVVSIPNPSGAPATAENPTGGSGIWGGWNDQQIQASFQATFGDNWEAEWERQHREELLRNGF